MPTVVLLFVNYRDYQHMTTLLDSNPLIPHGLKVVIVDNTEPEARDLAALQSWKARGCVVFEPPTNLGYLGAVRMVHHSTELLSDADFLLLSNTDISLSFDQTVQALSQATSATALDIGLYAPTLKDDNDCLVRQPHYYTRPSSRHFRRLATLYQFYHLAVLHRLLRDTKRRLLAPYQSTPRRTQTHECFAPHGALIVFLRQYFQSPDAFSFPQFLFCEEVFIGLNAQSHGLRCLELPGLSYAHANHGVIGSIPSRSAIKCLQRSHAWAAKALAEAESYEATR